MNAKYQRLIILRQLIAGEKASSQEKLLSMLAEEGYPVTQATLSRDLKELKAGKIPDGAGGYRYRLPESGFQRHQGTAQPHIAEDIRSVEFSGQMCVVRTLPGYANMIGSIVDGNSSAGIMGTIAGDDTLLVILRSSAASDRVLAEMEKLIPGISTKVI